MPMRTRDEFTIDYAYVVYSRKEQAIQGYNFLLNNTPLSNETDIEIQNRYNQTI